jgi:hypothetical protein
MNYKVITDSFKNRKSIRKKLVFTAFAVGLGLTANLMAQVPSYVPSNGLVGWWPFNGNANDESGNGNNGTVNGATLTTDRFGNAGKAYSFDGVDDYIQTNLIGPTTNSSRSINYWMKSSSNQQYMTVIGYGDNLNYKDFHIWHNWGCDGININISNAALTYTTGLLNDNWNNFVIVFDNSLGDSITKIKLYENGILLSNTCSTFGSGVINTGNTYPITIGKYHASNLHYFYGLIDDIGVWNRALTDQEISDLYNANICYDHVTVTDTLVINTGITGYNPITYLNTLKIWPNPSNDHITIDAGNLATMNGYSIKIEDAQGQQVFQNAVNQQQFYVDITTWGGNGLYFVRIIDPQGNTVDIKKIVLQ